MERIDIASEELNQLLERARERLSEEDYRKLKAAIDTLEYLTELVADKDTTIRHLRQLLLPGSTEKTNDVLARLGMESTAVRAKQKPEGEPRRRKRIGNLGTGATVLRHSREPAKCRSLTPS
jgi:hypothetical protein